MSMSKQKYFADLYLNIKLSWPESMNHIYFHFDIISTNMIYTQRITVDIYFIIFHVKVFSVKRKINREKHRNLLLPIFYSTKSGII